MIAKDCFCGNHMESHKRLMPMYDGLMALWARDEYFGTYELTAPLCFLCETSRFLCLPKRFIVKDGGVDWGALPGWLEMLGCVVGVPDRSAVGDENEYWWGCEPSHIAARFTRGELR